MVPPSFFKCEEIGKKNIKEDSSSALTRQLVGKNFKIGFLILL